MKNYSKQELIELLTIPYAEFEQTIRKEAREQYVRDHNVLYGSAMLGYSNVCKNNCLYCGMRGGNTCLKRYRVAPEDVVAAARTAKEMGFTRIFIISGEDLGYGYENVLQIVRGIKDLGLHLSMACGEFKPEQYEEFAALGADEYVLKFEMSDPDTFNRLNPNTSHAQRMHSIEAVKKSGMKLASGNIVDFPGHTIEQMADDILLMKDLDISWAPIVPYMPAKGTPLAEEGGRGDLTLNLREISILRLMMPNILITAQQPGPDLSRGLGDAEGNLLAIESGANILFADLLPDALVRHFSVVDSRVTLSADHIRRMAEETGMTLQL